jgi:hypothetical protein
MGSRDRPCTNGNLAMAALAGLIDAYVGAPKSIRQAVAGMSRDQLRARPVPGRWSTLEVVCHLADSDAVGADRIKRVIAEDRPTLLAYDENRFAAALAYHERDLEEELALIDLTRRNLARILRTIPPEALSRVGIHSERGPETLERLLQINIDHVSHHVKFILEKRKVLGLCA